jgi:predicted TIM-barrel fold metal-dependent hydrolase
VEPPDPTRAVRREADRWRAERRLIDLHQHVGFREDYLRRNMRIMDAVGVGTAVNLSGGTTTHAPGKPSEFEQNKRLADRLFPGRYVLYMNLDYSGWDEPGFAEQAARQVEEGARLGAGGFKQEKSLGLYLRDKAGKLLRVDDPKLDGVWRRCGELGLPVSIHVADPHAFWLPYNSSNERWKELKDHPHWWFGDPAKFPRFEELLAALDRVISRHPQTTFVCVHFANNAEDLEWVERALDRHPNMMADLAARIPEIGRHDPAAVRRLFLKHQDRIVFATDFQVYDHLTLGSGDSGPPKTDADAIEFYTKHWRWLETNDRQFAHMTPIQGDWKIDAIGLPAPVLRKVYFDNAHRLLVRALPLPVIHAVRIGKDLELDATMGAAAWQNAPVARLEYTLKDGLARPEIATTARLLWSDNYLYIGYQAPFSQLTVFDPPWLDRDREGLWDKDVVEAFIGTDPAKPKRYTEYEVAPTGEKLDLLIGPNEPGLAWDSGYTAAVAVDDAARLWNTVMRIPLTALSETKPTVGTRWRLNLYRHDIAHRSFLAWGPTGTSTAHTPERFGILVFGE